MREMTSQDAVDERIHRFMARKSPMRTLSKTIADHLASDQNSFGTESGISFEQTRWQRTHVSQKN